MARFSLFSLIFFCSCVFATAQPIMIVDAGSSHTEAFLFHVDNYADGRLPKITLIRSHRSAVPIAQFTSDPIQATWRILAMLKAIDDRGAQPVPVWIYATAGMRALAPTEQKKIYDALQIAFAKQTHFRLQEAKTISGEMEGIYGWLSVNYLLGNFNSGKPTVGVVDMGGGSTEITFAKPSLASPEKQYRDIQVGAKTYHLFARSFLGMGEQSLEQTLYVPSCYPSGLNLPHHKVGLFDYKNCQFHLSSFSLSGIL